MEEESNKHSITLSRSASELGQENWSEVEAQQEGELTVDVFQDDKNIYIQSPVAGVKPEDLEISIHHDMITIRGSRDKGVTVMEKDYFYQECFWGRFSRSIILPLNIQSDKIKAQMDNGILTITLPKLKRQKNIPIKIKT